ncbi:transposase [Streptomyces sp. Vc74B-19]|uniref:IS701 family transposase n=1 Tax=Streptomyces sp. Vc74B-19 TaxID=2741324 RepID=UPI001BFCC40B|nr:transposase [Streptomyces sp. Vc74B-19]MBT3165194.1 transposase [Streptomyces sp. Vc74B-19]
MQRQYTRSRSTSSTPAVAGTRRWTRSCIPRSWTTGPGRCRAAGLGADTAFATMPELAARMVGRFLDTGHHAKWVATDEVYGGNPTLEPRGVGHVRAVTCNHEATTGAGKFRADTQAAKVPKRAWQKLSAAAGAKGHRFYDWAVLDLTEPAPGSHQLLIRRNRATGELAYYRCWSPAPVPLATLVRVAGSRWWVEGTFQAGEGLAGLDEHQVRRYTSWFRRVTLAMLAHAFLAVVRADEYTCDPSPDGLIPLTCNEIQRLFTAFVRPMRDVVHRLG